MKYQLVIQLPGSSLEDYDRMIALEEAISKCLDGIGNVDGHDMGVGETNIFLRVEDPQAAFTRIVPALSNAYRKEGADSYVVLFPPGCGDL